VWALRQQLTGGITEAIVAHVHRGEHDRTQVTCPRCQGVLKAREHVCRTVETMVGPVQFERPYFYCRTCREGMYPLDDALGLVAGCKQLDMQQAAAQLVTEVPYDTAQALFRDLTGVPFGSERMHTLTNQVAEHLTVVAVAPSRPEIERRIAEVAAGRCRRCWDYLNEHRGRTHYRHLRRGGYPLGSGGIASSNKFICHVRLKRSGAWWYEANSNQMLALRCAKYNGTLEQVFARYQQRLRET